MKMTLAAAAALMVAAGAASAQTTPSTSTMIHPTAPATAPAAMAPPVGMTAPSATGTTTTGTTSTMPGSQTPGASVNTTPDTTSPHPSSVQTTNTTHRTAAAPVPGRNSFTHNQAAYRIGKAGYTHVTDLKKDNQGIWRGKAMKGGAAVSVSLDYQGNVTAN